MDGDACNDGGTCDTIDGIGNIVDGFDDIATTLKKTHVNCNITTKMLITCSHSCMHIQPYDTITCRDM